MPDSPHTAFVATVLTTIFLTACGPLTAAAHRTKQRPYAVLGDDCLQVISMKTALDWDLTKAPGAKSPQHMNPYLQVSQDPSLHETLFNGPDHVNAVSHEMGRLWWKPVSYPHKVPEGGLPQYWYRFTRNMVDEDRWGLSGYGSGRRFRHLAEGEDHTYKACMRERHFGDFLPAANAAIDAENEPDAHSKWCVVSRVWDFTSKSYGAGIVVCPSVMLDTVRGSSNRIPTFARDAQRTAEKREQSTKRPTSTASRLSRRSPFFSGQRDFGVLDGSKCFTITRTHSQALNRWFSGSHDFPLAPSSKDYIDSDEVIDLGVRSSSNRLAPSYWGLQSTVNPAGWLWVRKGTIPVYVWRPEENPADNVSPGAVHARQEEASPVAPCLTSYPAERFGSLHDVRQELDIEEDTLCTVARKVVKRFYKFGGPHNGMPTSAHVSTICPVERLAARRRYRWFGSWRPRNTRK